MEQLDLKTVVRQTTGNGPARRLRQDGKVPAVVYGPNTESIALTVDIAELERIMKVGSTASLLFNLIVENGDTQTKKAMIKEIQRDPVSRKILHIDFQRVKDTDKIHMHVPLHFVGEDKAPGVKAGGLISHLLTSVDIQCMAKDLPEYIEVDVSTVESGQAVHLSELKLPAGVELPALAHGAEYDTSVFVINPPKGGAVEGEEEAGAEAAGGEE